MPKKQNNHYVPRLILRKFNERISTYNLETEKLKINQKLENVFYSKNLYSIEIEEMFNQMVEDKFAKLLNNVILSSEDICTLKRNQVHLVKKFLLLAMLRTMESEHVAKSRASKLRTTVKTNYGFDEKQNISDLSSFDYWMQTLKCVLESKSLYDVQKNDNATAVAVYWSNVFISGYISIWDSTMTNEEFIIMDQGMTSEHEKTRFLPPYNEDMIKRGYLIGKINRFNVPSATKELNQLYKYIQIALANDCFSENMYLFTLSKSRMIAFINPFFRLYDKKDWYEFQNPEIPDIWTTSIQDVRLFEKNKNIYVDLVKSKHGLYNEDDQYVYKIHDMILDDVIYINCLVLDRIEKILGFSEAKGILRSLVTYSCISKSRKDYSHLINYLKDLGYETKKTKNLIDLAKKISVLNINFTNSEKQCIANYVEFVSRLKRGKKET